MDSFEEAFGNVERTAASTAKRASDLAKVAKKLEKASREGNIAAIKREQSGLADALTALRQEVSNASQAWEVEEYQEEEYLRNSYAAELKALASEKGLNIFEEGGTLISHPSILRILPTSREVLIDKKKTSMLRPSHLVATLLQNQRRGPRFRTGRFLESLYSTYLLVDKTQPNALANDRHGPVIPLEHIYSAFTSLPGMDQEYSKANLARDLFHLESSGALTTRGGMIISFHASSGQRSTRGIFPFVAPDGSLTVYYSIRFSKDR